MEGRSGVTDKNGELFAVPQRVRTSALVARHDLRDENIQVNGNTFIIDFSGVGPKHMTQMSIQDMRNWMNCWQNSFPGRFKSFHYYNIGAVFDAMMTLFRPMMSKKLQERIHVHETAESLYKSVGMDVLPIEYLPDDYTGPSAGSIQQIIQKLKEDVMEQKFRQHMLRFSSAQSINIDESKRPAYEPVNESFRKLAVD